jgi:phenylalanyl-tRNA synthetase alpha chain
MTKKSASKEYAIRPEYVPVLDKLQALGEPIEARELSSQMNLEYEKLMSGAVYTLNQLGLAKYSENEVEQLTPTEEGLAYIQNGLPERQLFGLLTKEGRKEMTVADFQGEAENALGLDKKLFFIGLSNMKKNKWVLSSKATAQESLFVTNDTVDQKPEEQLLQWIGEHQSTGGAYVKDLPKELEDALKALMSRKLLNREKKTVRIIELTAEGQQVSKDQLVLKENEVFRLTPEMIKTGSWEENLANLKKYDVAAYGPRIQVGKTHPMTNLINEIREIFHAMGFNEIKGPIVEMAFFNFDALYQPQDHPAREMHDTFYLKNPSVAKLPPPEKVDAIRQVHENGGNSGSLGWRYNWSEDIAKKMLLRTHTTATTLRRLSMGLEEGTPLPQKYFCIDRVFRNEKVDWKHLAEFQQIEGIVIGEKMTLSDLIGQIVEFYKRMGFNKVMTVPGFFPYTEPSMEIAVFSEERQKWMQLGGSGIFRPEVTYPWGIKDPVRVIAWGMGLERLAMLRFKRADIRDLYQSPLSWLREVQY